MCFNINNNIINVCSLHWCLIIFSQGFQRSWTEEQKLLQKNSFCPAQQICCKKVKLPWLQHHSVTRWKWSELILRERHGTSVCPTWAEFTLDNFFTVQALEINQLRMLTVNGNSLGASVMPCAACSKCYATNSMLWFYFWQFLKHDKNDEAGRLQQTSVLAQSSCAWCSDTPLLQTSCLPSGESMWICSFFLSVCNSPTEQASFSTSTPYFEQLLLLFFFFFATNCLRHLYSIMEAAFCTITKCSIV